MPRPRSLVLRGTFLTGAERSLLTVLHSWGLTPQEAVRRLAMPDEGAAQPVRLRAYPAGVPEGWRVVG